MTPAARRDAIVSTIPTWYRPSVHMATPSLFGLAVLALAASFVRSPSLAELATVPITWLAAVGFEWRVHKFVLHRRAPLLGTLYVRHELEHHVVFTDRDMAIRSPRELRLVLMPAYAVALAFTLVVPFAALTWLALGPNVAGIFVTTSMAYFVSYEMLHAAYHFPPESFVGRLPFVARLREHHRRHHEPRLMHRWNFNVTIPLFDRVHGTVWSPEREAERPPRPRAAHAAAPRRA